MNLHPGRARAPRARTTRIVVAGALLVPLAAAPALAETVEATGVGQAQVRVSGELTQAKIAAAVTRARALAVPRAFINARTQAGLYAAAAGLTLGRAQSVEEPPASPYGFGYGAYFGSSGRFGPNQFCGRVTSVKRRVIDGRRRVVSRRTRVRCFKPEIAVVSLYVSFTAAPAPASAPAA